MKKAQKGAKVNKAPDQTAKQKQNIKDAMQMKNMRPVFKGGGKAKKYQAGGVAHPEPKAPDKKGPFITVQKRNLKNK